MTKTLATLPNDIYDLFNPEKEHVCNEENIQHFLDNLGELLRSRLSGRNDDPKALRFSNLGRPNRFLWYTVNGYGKEALAPKTNFKFLYGDVIEQLILFLAKEAGHTVEHEQAEVEVDGILGHVDAVIDGVTVDVKSASPYSFKKFKDGSVFEDDPFGYIQQVSGYANVLTPDRGGAFVAFDKVHGDICVMNVGASITASMPPGPRIAELRTITSRTEPPERCYPDLEDGKSGNRKLGTACSYCVFKQSCWPNLRTFVYASGPKFLTHVARTPDVPETIAPVDEGDEE